MVRGLERTPQPVSIADELVFGVDGSSKFVREFTTLIRTFNFYYDRSPTKMCRLLDFSRTQWQQLFTYLAQFSLSVAPDSINFGQEPACIGDSPNTWQAEVRLAIRHRFCAG